MQEGRTIGLIVPSADVNIEAFYHQFAPAEIAVATNRISFDGLHMQSLEQMVSSSEQAAVDLCHAEPDILISSSLTLGCFLDTTLQRCIEQRTGVPCITSLYAFLKILEHMPSRRLALLMPYQEDINALFIKTLEQNGVNVCYIECLKEINGGACRSIREIQVLDVLSIVEQINLPALRASGADLLLIGASGLGGPEKISLAEELLGLPVLLPEQLTLLYALAYLESYAPIPTLGSIFQNKTQTIAIT